LYELTKATLLAYYWILSVTLDREAYKEFIFKIPMSDLLRLRLFEKPDKKAIQYLMKTQKYE
jgi:hypothetical protein